jgi:hypothetical protein
MFLDVRRNGVRSTPASERSWKDVAVPAEPAGTIAEARVLVAAPTRFSDHSTAPCNCV